VTDTNKAAQNNDAKTIAFHKACKQDGISPLEFSWLMFRLPIPEERSSFFRPKANENARKILAYMKRKKICSESAGPNTPVLFECCLWAAVELFPESLYKNIQIERTGKDDFTGRKLSWIDSEEEIIKAREIADNALVSLKINKNQCPTDFYLMLVAGAHFLREERAVVTRDFRRNETIATVLRGLGLKKTVATSAAHLLKLKK